MSFPFTSSTMSTSTTAFGQTSNPNSNFSGSAPANGVMSMGVCETTWSTSPFAISQNTSRQPCNCNNGMTPLVYTSPRCCQAQARCRYNPFPSPTNGRETESLFSSGPKPTSSPSNVHGSSIASMSSSSSAAFGTPLCVGPFGQTTSFLPSGGIPSPFANAPTPSSPFTYGSLTGQISTPFPPTFDTNASRSTGIGSDFKTASGEATMPWGSTLSRDQNPFTGSQVKAPNFGPFGVNQASRVTSYTKTTEFDEKGADNILVSISAMPAYRDKSHEELRWEDHHRFNAAGGGVVPAFGRNHSTFPNPLSPSDPFNSFATKVTSPSIGQFSFLNHVPLTYRGPVPPVPSSLFATTVTPPPSIGQYLFTNHVKANLESVLNKMEEWEKSTQLICKDVKRFQEDMKSWTERDRSLELEKIEATQTINQLREELGHVTRSKEAIIAEYLASPAFSKRLDEEHEKRLSKIFHPSYVKALGAVQTKLPEMDSFSSQRPATSPFPQTGYTLFGAHNPSFGHT
ncbi:hypothetical protein POM88_030293 [Heracleum sosnowskyi]|uniref:Uncharacterized protein n=1 Tax=Heracleum sosnowskyi TaxID=360622 RepID=A0AAD8MFM3_9APIA|nr:hypothetical protein POM88_030293 [Heracleum sosnowskyi]